MKFLMNRKEMFAAFACLCMFMLNASCTNLSAVREWSKTSLEASQFNGIVATYVDTPVRLKRYDKLRFEQYRKPTGEQKRMFSLRQSLYDTNVTERKNQAEALKQILSVVSDYMGALATLSADGTVDYSKHINTLNTEIGNLRAKHSDKRISASTLAAAGSIVQTLLKPWQARQVNTLIGQANAPLQTILAGELRQLVANDFQNDLKTEGDMIDLYYDALLDDGHPSSAAQDAVTEWREVRREQNNARLHAIAAYLSVLDNIAKGHQKLYDNRNKLDDKRLVNDLCLLVNDLRKQITILTKSL